MILAIVLIIAIIVGAFVAQIVFTDTSCENISHTWRND